MTAAIHPHQFVMHRLACTLHCRNRAADRALPMTLDEIEVLSRRIDLCRPAFERPGQIRYRLGVRRGNGDRFRVIYDTQLQTVVTIQMGRLRAYEAPLHETAVREGDGKRMEMTA